MTISNKSDIKILSFCDNTSFNDLWSSLNEIDCIWLDETYVTHAPAQPLDLLSDKFWASFNLDLYDVVLLPFTSNELGELKEHLAENPKATNKPENLWSWLPVAVIGVLEDDSIHDAVIAAQLDFDGILARPFHLQHLERMLRSAMKRNKQKRQLTARYKKLQGLFRRVSNSRRHLRDKVDFLCRDLVQSNVDLTTTLSGLRRAYDFQSELTGEFDMRFMLHKALRQIKEQVSDSNAAIYLCNSRQIDAHIVSCWQDNPVDTETLESQFIETVVPQAIQTGQSFIVPDASQWQDVSPKHRSELTGLSIIGTPIALDNELFGVLCVYRHSDNKLTQNELNAIQPYIAPFSRAIEALQRLEELLI